jgi:hypothetical protein
MCIGIFGDLLSAAIDYGVNKFERTVLGESKEESRKKFKHCVEIELVEKAQKTKVLNLLVDFYNPYKRGEFADCLFYVMSQKFGLKEDTDEAVYMKTVRFIHYGETDQGHFSAFAFYNGQLMLVSGAIGDNFFGIKVIGEGSYNLCQTIINFLSFFEAVGWYDVADNLDFHDKKIYKLAEQLIKNPAEDGNIYGIDEEDSDTDIDGDDEEYAEDESCNHDDGEIIELCQFFKVKYPTFDKTALKKVTVV